MYLELCCAVLGTIAGQKRCLFHGTDCTLTLSQSDKGIVGICGREGRGRKDHCMGIGKGMVPFFER